MKGLLLKDWFVLWKYAKWNLGLALAFILLSIASTNTVFPLISILFFAMLPLTAMGLDERCRWDSFASTMPFSRVQLVLSRYLTSLIGIAICIALFALVSVLSNVIGLGAFSLRATIESLYMMISVGVLVPAITLPISFKLGVEKSRITYMLAFALVGAIITAYINVTGTPANTLSVIAGLPSAVAPVIAIILLVLSACISIQIYKRKDL